MALYVNPENQTLLWSIINKNQTAQQFFTKITPQQKENWFKSIIQLFYNNNASNVITIQELKQINRDSLTYMVNDIRTRINTNVNGNGSFQPERKSIETLQPSTIATSRPQDIQKSSSINADLVNQQFNTRQKEYEQMVEKKTPDAVKFTDAVDDQPISNMDELIRNHIKQRDEEFRIYSPPPISGSTNNPGIHPLKIDSAKTNITLTVEDIVIEPVSVDETPSIKMKKSVSWNEPIPESGALAKFSQWTSMNNEYIERQNMHYAEFESFKLMVRDMSNTISLLQTQLAGGV